jgi:hypothetical protein
MPDNKGVTIQLTPKQKQAVRSFTGQEHNEIRLETPLASKMTPAAKRVTPAAKRVTPAAKRVTPAAKRVTPAAKRVTPASKTSL